MEAGKKLSDLNINYNKADLYKLNVEMPSKKIIENFKISKMYYGKKDKQIDKTVIYLNDKIKISNIPTETNQYIISGKSALDWIVERYQFTEDIKETKLINDPNDLLLENSDFEYIIKLIQRVVTVSVESVKIKNSLPKIDEIY